MSELGTRISDVGTRISDVGTRVSDSGLGFLTRDSDFGLGYGPGRARHTPVLAHMYPYRTPPLYHPTTHPPVPLSTGYRTTPSSTRTLAVGLASTSPELKPEDSSSPENVSRRSHLDFKGAGRTEFPDIAPKCIEVSEVSEVAQCSFRTPYQKSRDFLGPPKPQGKQ